MGTGFKFDPANEYGFEVSNLTLTLTLATLIAAFLSPTAAVCIGIGFGASLGIDVLAWLEYRQGDEE